MLLSNTLLTSDNIRISYNHYLNGKDRIITIAHGFYTSKNNYLIQRLIGGLVGYFDICAFDFRGHGESGGLFTWTTKEEKDLLSVLKYIKDKGYTKIGLIGFSLGGSISINTIVKNSGYVDSLVCISAPSDLRKIDYKLWKLDWENDVFYNFFTREGREGKGVRVGPFWFKKDKPIDNIKRIDIPVFFIHGDKDWVVGSWHSQKMYESIQETINKKILIINNGPHAEYLLRKFYSTVVDSIMEWFKDTLK